MQRMKNKWMWIAVLAIIMTMVLAACTKGNAPSEGNKESGTKTPEPSAQPAESETAAAWSELKITVTGFLQTGNKVPQEDVLTPIWREQTKVVPQIINARDENNTVQKWLVANTLPDVFATLGNGRGSENYKLLKENNKLREITKEDMIRYMPRLTKWLEQLGSSVDQLYAANVDTDGKLWQVPNMPNYYALPGLKGTRFMESLVGYAPYNQFVRDDILKEIFPEAKSEAELKELYVKQGGKLSYEDVTDIPIDSMDDLLDFMRKIQALNKKVGDKPVYPAQLQSSSQNVNSLLWSMFTVPGFMWSHTGERPVKEEVMTYAPLTPEWKDYYKFLNTAYNEKLFDPEAFIQKDDQLSAKIINGEYAIFNAWGPVADARALSKNEGRGYGYRMMPVFRSQPVVGKYQDFRPSPVSLDGSASAVLITTNISDEQLPQVLNWIDWNMSEEANELRTWGLPEWSTGTGEERRFKPEYQDLENWAVRGTAGEKDGNYYGMYDINTNASVGAAAFNPETYGILGLGYAYSPTHSYPPDLTKEINMDQIQIQVENKHMVDQMWFYQQVGWDFTMLDPEGKFNAIDSTNGVYSAAAGGKVVNAIVGKPADFDKNYEAYLGVYNDEWRKEFALMQERWKDIWNTKIKPELDKVKK